MFGLNFSKFRPNIAEKFLSHEQVLDWLDDRSGIRSIVKKPCMKKYQVVQDGDMFGVVVDICFFYPGSDWDTSLDVIQSKCTDCLGKRLFYSISDVGGVVPAWSSSLHGTSYDCALSFTLDAGDD